MNCCPASEPRGASTGGDVIVLDWMITSISPSFILVNPFDLLGN